jgi:hypothetical protein
MRGKRMALALFSVGFGFMIAGGGAFEVVNLLQPSLFAEAQDNPIMRLHHAEPVVFGWTLGANLAGILAGLAFAVTGVGLWRRRPWSAPLGRLAARTMFVSCAGGALVCALYLVPPLWRGLADPARHVESLVLLVSVAGSTLLVPVFPAILHAALAPARAGRFLPNNPAASVLPIDDHSSPAADPGPDPGAGVGLRARNQPRSS